MRRDTGSMIFAKLVEVLVIFVLLQYFCNFKLFRFSRDNEVYLGFK